MCVNLLGVLTVYYKQGDMLEGFNASYKILSCADDCPDNHVCHAGQCVCADGRTGTNCSIEMCPGNCSSDKKQGTCDKVSNIMSLVTPFSTI
jgi:hypothetical protein